MKLYVNKTISVVPSVLDPLYLLYLLYTYKKFILKKLLITDIRSFTMKKNASLYCGNCGEPGHIYKKCLQPITSMGVIVFQKKP